MFSFAPLLIGAGVGALGGLLTGKDPLKGAAMGAAMGGAGSALGSAGAWTGGGASVAGTQGAAGLTSAAMPSLAPQMATTGMGTAASMGSNYMPSYMPEMGMANSFDLASGMPMASQGFEQTMYNNPLLSASAEQGGIAAPEASMFDSISPYMNIDNLQGASSVYDKFSQEEQRMPQAPAGGMSAGKAPQGSDIQALIAGIKPIQRKRISLL